MRHVGLAELQKILMCGSSQNIDDLHRRAGSANICTCDEFFKMPVNTTKIGL
jgi:NAD-dependent SIR2 family protein deacetylase